MVSRGGELEILGSYHRVRQLVTIFHPVVWAIDVWYCKVQRDRSPDHCSELRGYDPQSPLRDGRGSLHRGDTLPAVLDRLVTGQALGVHRDPPTESGGR